jgi:thioredoxin 1
MENKIQNLSDQNFQKKISLTTGLAVVGFGTDWSMPFQMVVIILERLAGKDGKTIPFFKLDVEKNPRTPARLGIRGIPTVIIFKDGRPVKRITGTQPSLVFENAIKGQL